MLFDYEKLQEAVKIIRAQFTETNLPQMSSFGTNNYAGVEIFEAALNGDVYNEDQAIERYGDECEVRNAVDVIQGEMPIEEYLETHHELELE